LQIQGKALIRSAPALVIALAAVVPAAGQQADLALTKIGNPVTGSSPQDHTYTLRIENLGPDAASGVTVTDLLTNDAIFDSASPGCTYDAMDHEVTCTVASLAASASVEFEIVVDVTAWPQHSEAGLVLAGIAPAVGQPVLAMVGTRYDDHEVFATGEQLVTPRDVEGEPGPTVVIADAVDPTHELGGVPVVDGRVIRVHQATGAQSIVSSEGELLNPSGIAVDDDGRIYVADTIGPTLPDQLGRVIEVDPSTGAQTVLASGGHLEHPYGIELLTDGDLIVADSAGRLVKIDPSTGAQTLVSEFGSLVQPRAVATIDVFSVVVADASSGLVKVNLSTGAQNIVLPVDGITLCEPTAVESDFVDWFYVADPVCGAGGVVHMIFRLDPVDIYRTFGDPSWECPKGIGLLDVFTNRAAVTSTTQDPDPSNNSDFLATELEEGYEPPNEVDVTETVTVSDEVSIEVLTPVVIEVLETITVADLVEARPALRIDVSEHVSVSDDVGARLAVRIDLLEQITVSDHLLAAPALRIDLTESIAVTDSVIILGPNDIFFDGFESGDTSAWSRTVGGI
jgi:uncharacterized repeat protein (TIGR01451 family)